MPYYAVRVSHRDSDGNHGQRTPYLFSCLLIYSNNMTGAEGLNTALIAAAKKAAEAAAESAVEVIMGPSTTVVPDITTTTLAPPTEPEGDGLSTASIV